MLSAVGDTERTGIIILGNSGAGKSLICNIIIGEDQFTSAFRVTSVTTATRAAQLDYGSESLSVFDIPGLVEVKKVNVDRNKREIEKAFKECPRSRVVFVWSVTGGRIRHEDIIAFEALHRTYEFQPASLLFLVNTTTDEWTEEYEENILLLLSQLLEKFQFTSENVLFLPKLNLYDKEEKKQMHDKILGSIMTKSVQLFVQQTPIKLEAEQVQELKEEIRRREEQFGLKTFKLKRQLTEVEQELKATKNRDFTARVDAGHKWTSNETDTNARVLDRDRVQQLLYRIGDAHYIYKKNIEKAARALKRTDELAFLELSEAMSHAEKVHDDERKKIQMEFQELLQKRWSDALPCKIF